MVSYCFLKVLHVQPVNELSECEIVENTTNGFTEVVVYYYQKKNTIAPIRLFNNIKAHLKGFNIINQNFNIDACHLHVTLPAGLFVLYLKYFHRIPYVVTEHWSKFSSGLNNFGSLDKILIKKVWKNSKHITTVSETILHTLKLNTSQPTSLIPNYVDTSVFKFSKRDSKYNKRFLHISTGQKLKNLDLIIRGFSHFSKNNNNCTLTIICDESPQDFIILSKELNTLNENIFFEDATSQEGIQNTMLKHDAYICLSNYESFGIVLAEAVASGLTLLSTDVGIASKLISCDNKHILIKSPKESSLIESLKTATKQSSIESENGYNFVNKNYSKKVICSNFRQIYSSINN